MEYHAIEEASSFDRIKDVLIKKAAAGVEVRLFYDDVGSIFFLNKDFSRKCVQMALTAVYSIQSSLHLTCS